MYILLLVINFGDKSIKGNMSRSVACLARTPLSKKKQTKK